jgi:hypothetical protein
MAGLVKIIHNMTSKSYLSLLRRLGIFLTGSIEGVNQTDGVLS